MKYINDGTFEAIVSDNGPEEDEIQIYKTQLCRDKDYIIDALQKNTLLPMMVHTASGDPHPMRWFVKELFVEGEGQDRTLLAIISGRNLLKQVAQDANKCRFKIFAITTHPLLTISEIRYSPDIHIKGREESFLRDKEDYLISALLTKGRDMQDASEEFNFFKAMRKGREHTKHIIGEAIKDLPTEDVSLEERIKCCDNFMTLFDVVIDGENPVVNLTWGCFHCCNLKEMMFDSKELKELINILR